MLRIKPLKFIFANNMIENGNPLHIIRKNVNKKTKLRYIGQIIVNNDISIATIKKLRKELFGIDDFHGPFFF